jgi:hypothetical protein
MALIGIDGYVRPPGTTGTSSSDSKPAASAQADATAKTAADTTAPHTGPQPLNTTGSRGTNVHVVT